MKKVYSLIFSAFLITVLQNISFSQGCIAIRNITGGSNVFSNDSKTWLFSANYRYFHSYKHFVGTEEQTQRVDQHTNVINNDNSVIVSANYTLNPRWNFTLSVPFIYINRSSLYEHYGNSSGQRFHTVGNGLGDIRLMANYKVVDGAKLKMQVGLGTKLPTGNYRYKDFFHKKGSEGQDTLISRYVDQSIQPGDGGLGIIAAADLIYMLADHWSIYANGMYMANPRNTNGVVRSANLTNDANGNPLPHSNEFSVADQYFARAGARYQINGSLETSLGGRIECIPSHDLIGREDGFRRPGYIVSVDPAVFYVKGNHIFGLNVPVALVRNRTRSYTDIQRGNDANGTPYHGDAAFADFLVSISYAFKLSKVTANTFGTGQDVVK